MNVKHAMVIASFMIVWLFFMPVQAMAKGLYDHQDIIVPENQTVDNVIVIGGDATILGTVDDAVVVLNGNVHLKSTARINGFVFVVGGNVQQEKGAAVKDEIMSFSLDHATKNSLLIGGGLIVGTWLLQLAFSILLMILPVLTIILSKGRITIWFRQVRQSPGRLLYTGLLSSMLLIAIMILLFVTIIGIPVAVFIFLLAGLTLMFGFTVLSLWVGEKIQGIAGQSEAMIALTGSLIMVSMMNVPLVGAFLFVGIWVFSIGVMTVWILEKLKRKSTI